VHGEDAEIARELQALPARADAKTPIHDLMVDRHQRPAVLGGPEDEAPRCDILAARTAGFSNLKRGDSVS
jgi:hypothetical protein